MPRGKSFSVLSYIWKVKPWTQTLPLISVQRAEREASYLPASPASTFKLLLLVIFVLH